MNYTENEILEAVEEGINLHIKPDEKLYEFYIKAQIIRYLDYYKKVLTFNPELSVKKYDEVVNDMFNTYGENSLVYLISVLYKYSPVRNDYDNIILIKNKNEIQPLNNYLILTEQNEACIVIQQHKTVRLHGIIDVKFSSYISNLIKQYVINNNIIYGNKLFGKLTDTIKKISFNINKKNETGSNIIRRSLASSLYNDYLNEKATIDDIYNQVIMMKHSVYSHFVDYIYGIY